MNRALLLSMSSLLAGPAGCGGDDDLAPQGMAEVSVLHYDYAFDLETRDATLAATLLIEVEGNCVSLPVRAPTVTEVSFDGVAAESAEVAGEVLLACGEGWQEGQEVILSANTAVALGTWGPSQVGYSVTPDIDGDPFSYLVSWVGGCDRFGPCDSAPDRFATYRFAVTHPPGTTVLCPGTITAGDTETVCELNVFAPTYSAFGLVASPGFIEVPLGQWGSTTATLYDLPSVDMDSYLNRETAASFIEWMEGHFGPYPYGDELRLFTGPTYWNGFEHPGNIAIAQSLARPRTNLQHTVRHEIAHQWAGNQVTLASTYDFVWKEAMAEYLTFVFEEEVLGEGRGDDTARYWKTSAAGAAFYPVPSEAPPLLDYYGDVYGPGPMILFRQLEVRFGREAIMAALEDLLGEERALSVDDLKGALSSTTETDLTAYFDDWVYGEGAPVWPTFTLTYDQTGDGPVAYTLSQVTPAEPLGCRFVVQLKGAMGETHDVTVDLGLEGAAEISGTAAPGFVVTDYVIDPYAESLAARSIPAVAPAVKVPNPFVANPQSP